VLKEENSGDGLVLAQLGTGL